MNIPGMTKFKSFNDFNASASKEVDKQHASVLEEIDKFEKVEGRGPQSSGEFNRAVQKDLAELSERRPGIYKTPQIKYP